LLLELAAEPIPIVTDPISNHWKIGTCVTISDMEGVTHTVEVTAATLYEAAALGIKQIRGND